MIALPDLEAFLPGETASSAAARPASQEKKRTLLSHEQRKASKRYQQRYQCHMSLDVAR